MRPASTADESPYTSDGGTTVDLAATTASGSSPFALSAYSGYSGMTALAVSDTANARITTGLALSGAQTHNSLKIENPDPSESLALGANNLTLTSGGLLVTGANAFTISNTSGALIGGNGSGSYDLIVHQYNTGGLTISANIANNGANATALTKAGSGTLTLSGATNSFTGGAFVNNGTLAVALSNAPLGSGTITLAGGRLQLQSGLQAQSGSGIGIKFATGQGGTGAQCHRELPASRRSATGTTRLALPARISRCTITPAPAAAPRSVSPPIAITASKAQPGLRESGISNCWNSYLDSSSSAWAGQRSRSPMFPTPTTSAYLYVNSDTANRGQKANLTGSQTGPTYYYQTVGGANSTYVTSTSTTPGNYVTADYLAYSGLTNASSVTFVAGYDNNNGGIAGLEIVPTWSRGPVNLINAVAVTTNSTIDVTGYASASLGALSINGSKLSITGGSTGTNAAYGLTLGATTLTGNATFDVANNGSGTGTVALGAVGGSGFGFTQAGRRHAGGAKSGWNVQRQRPTQCDCGHLASLNERDRHGHVEFVAQWRITLSYERDGHESFV